MQVVKLTYPDRIETFKCSDLNTRLDDYVVAKVNQYKSERVDTIGNYTKISWYIDDEPTAYNTEIKCLRILANSGLTPKLITHSILLKVELIDGDELYAVRHVTSITTSYCGRSILELYFPADVRDEYCGPGVHVNDINNLEKDIIEYFPSQYVPVDIFNQIIQIIRTLYMTYKIEHDDIHAGNFCQMDDKIFVIDFDCVTLNG